VSTQKVVTQRWQEAVAPAEQLTEDARNARALRRREGHERILFQVNNIELFAQSCGTGAIGREDIVRMARGDEQALQDLFDAFSLMVENGLMIRR